jgi:hypothetical protein
VLFFLVPKLFNHLRLAHILRIARDSKEELSLYIYIHTKSDMLLYFKALIEIKKERRAFIVTYIWVFFFFFFVYMGFLFSYLWDSSNDYCITHTQLLYNSNYFFFIITIGFVFLHVGPKYSMVDLKTKIVRVVQETLLMGFYITHITLDYIYGFLNTVLIHVTLF